MKSLKNKLFEDLKLKNSEIVTIVGGTGTYTLNGQDNDPFGGGYDKLFDTCVDGVGTLDNVNTDKDDRTTKDKPLPPKTNIIS